MKKLTAFFMSVLLLFCLAACSNSLTDKTDSATNTGSKVSEQISDKTKTPDTTFDNSESEPEDTPDPAITARGKTLVVYYSATGNTEDAANYIAAATGGDIFKLVPKDDYTSADLNYSNSDSRVVYEHNHPEARDIELVKNTVDHWDEYDTIFIGYPIWWHIAAWPVDGFVKANDFTGKTVVPFCTSASSGLEDSGRLLAEMAGTGNWLEGQRFSSSVSEQTVTDWVASLNLNK